MKLNFEAKYSHTSSLVTVDSQTERFWSSSNTSFESSNNYTNFMTNEYKPFKYHASQPFASNTELGMFHSSYGLRTDREEMERPGQRWPKSKYFVASRPRQLITVTLSFAGKEFAGQGMTLQTAKHGAAEKAIAYFSVPENFVAAKMAKNHMASGLLWLYLLNSSLFILFKCELSLEKEKTQCLKENAKEAASEPSKKPEKREETKEEKNKETKSEEEKSPKSKTNKSEIQLVHELALRLKKNIEFQVNWTFVCFLF